MESEDIKPIDKSIVRNVVSKANDFIKRKYTLQNLKPMSELEIYCVDGRFYGKTQTLPYHCDEIKKENSVVFLFSLGCSANFYVHCPEMGGDERSAGTLFEFKSGDLHFFGATKKAKIYHGIESIGPASSCPMELLESLREKRVGLQIRAR